MHLDPDFQHLTYGDRGPRGQSIRDLESGDLVVFYSGLRSLGETRRDLVYAITGLYVVDEVVSAREVPVERWNENAHTRKRSPGPDDLVVRAKAGLSGRCSRCVDVGVREDSNYYVHPNLLAAWGGLSVRNGYLTRSAQPPRFLDAAKFHAWWRSQDIPLMHNNFG